MFVYISLARAIETIQPKSRARIRTNSLKQPQVRRGQDNEPRDNGDGADYSDEDNTSESALQYYNSQQADNQNRIVLIASDQDYNGLYGRPTTSRARDGYSRPVPKTTSNASRTKDVSKETVQTIRNYSKVNDDGSFTFGYEAADGSFKEETRGTDCVVR